jgi:hypothetical protein
METRATSRKNEHNKVQSTQFLSDTAASIYFNAKRAMRNQHKASDDGCSKINSDDTPV